MLTTRYSCHILKTFAFFSTDFSKYPQISNFHENPSSGNRVLPFGRTDGRTDMTKLAVAFRSFTNAPKKKDRKQARTHNYREKSIVTLLCQVFYIRILYHII